MGLCITYNEPSATRDDSLSLPQCLNVTKGCFDLEYPRYLLHLRLSPPAARDLGLICLSKSNINKLLGGNAKTYCCSEYFLSQLHGVAARPNFVEEVRQACTTSRITY